MPLYKYLTPDRLDVLANREIRFTQAAALNDPFELNTYFDVLVQGDELVKHILDNPVDIAPHIAKAYEGFSPEVKAQVPFELLLHLAKTTMESEEGQRVFWETIGATLGMLRDATPGLREQMTQTFKTKIGILSLSEVADSTLMWSHYAAQHHGFAIAFDERNAFFNRRRGPDDEFFHLRRVEYKPIAAFADVAAMEGQRILVTKGPEWSYEREWRMLVPVEMATRAIEAPVPIYLVEFPPSAIESVIVGARTSQETRQALVESLARAEYAHVRLHGARLDDRSGKVLVEAAA